MKQTLPKNEERKRIQLYKEGYNDVQIAKRCGVSKSAIAKWRKRRNLTAFTACKNVNITKKRCKK